MLKGYDKFYQLVESMHKLESVPFTTWYTDAHGDLLPINNDDNLGRAVSTARPLLRLFLQRRLGMYSSLLRSTTAAPYLVHY